VLRILTAITYPVLIYAGLTLVRPRTLAIILAVLLLAHGIVTWRQRGLAQVSLLLIPLACPQVQGRNEFRILLFEAST